MRGFDPPCSVPARFSVPHASAWSEELFLFSERSSRSQFAAYRVPLAKRRSDRPAYRAGAVAEIGYRHVVRRAELHKGLTWEVLFWWLTAGTQRLEATLNILQANESLDAHAVVHGPVEM